jgi:hypothetical protein
MVEEKRRRVHGLGNSLALCFRAKGSCDRTTSCQMNGFFFISTPCSEGGRNVPAAEKAHAGRGDSVGLRLCC